MKALTKKIVAWLLKTILKPKMNPNLAKSNKSFQSIKAQVQNRITEIQQFLTVNDPSLPSSRAYAEIVENFERISPDSFKYSIHGRNFFVETVYHPKANGVAQLITYETKYDKKSYPNLEFFPTSKIEVIIDEFGNSIVNNLTVERSLGLAYFDAVGYFMYP